MKNLKEAKELLEKYKSITIEQLNSIYKKHPFWTGKYVKEHHINVKNVYTPLE